MTPFPDQLKEDFVAVVSGFIRYVIYSSLEGVSSPPPFSLQPACSRLDFFLIIRNVDFASPHVLAGSRLQCNSSPLI